MKDRLRSQHRAVHTLIYVSSAIFIAILQLTGWMEASIRTLHMLQTLIYVAVIVLCARRNVAGYGAGIGIASFWNIANLFVTNFFRSGWTVLVHLIRTGNDANAPMIVAPIAVLAHFVLIGACITAYVLRPKKTRSDIAVLLLGAFAAIVSFFAMIRTFGPQYLHIFWTMLGWIGIHVRA